MKTRFRSLGIKSLIPTGNLALWLRADRGVILDTTNTPTVLQWLDQSGNKRHATQGTKAAQPTLGITNNQPALYFNDAQWLDGLCGSLTEKTVYAVYSVNEVDGGLDGVFGFTANTADANMGTSLFQGSGSSSSSYTFRLANTFSNRYDIALSRPLSNSCRLFSGWISSSSISARFGENPASTASHTVTLPIETAYKLGARFTNVYPLKGSISELITYNYVQPDSVQETIRNYLKRKYTL